MRAYFKRRYSPENILLAAAGRIDFDRLVAARRAGLRPLAARANVSRRVEPAEPHPGFLAVAKPTASQQYALQLAAGPAAADADRYAAKLLAMVLGDDSGSRLYWELVDSGLAEQCELSHHEYEGAGVYFTYMSCAPRRRPKTSSSSPKSIATRRPTASPPPRLKQAKSKVRSRIVLSSERPRGRLFAIGSDWIYRRQYRPVKEDLDTVAAVGVDQLAAVLDKHRLDCSMTITVGPLEVVPAAT